MSFFGIKGAFFSKTTRRICAKFLGENTCSLQPALKSNAPDLNTTNDKFHFFYTATTYCTIAATKSTFHLWSKFFTVTTSKSRSLYGM